MCIQCQQWESQAHLVWNELYGEVDALRSLVPRFPPPIALTATQILGGMTWTPSGVNSAIQYLTAQCPLLLPPGDALALVAARGTIVSEGWKWIGAFRPLVQYARTSLPLWGGSAATPIVSATGQGVHDASHQMFSTWLDSLNRLHEDTNQTLDQIEASNRRINQGLLNMLRGG